jgi:signal recognition particle receptor subunit beta
MTTIAFDTHFFIKKLTSHGLPEKHAEAIIDVIRETKEADLHVVATKADLNLLKADLRELELKLENKMIDMKITIIQWMIGLLFLQAGMIISVIKLL